MKNWITFDSVTMDHNKYSTCDNHIDVCILIFCDMPKKALCSAYFHKFFGCSFP